MMKKFLYFKLICALLGGGLLVGCATSTTVQTRKQERFAAYQALPPDLQAAVNDGRVKAGMNMDAVYIAWGNPSQVVSGGNQSGESTTWLYEAGYLQEVRYWGGYRPHYASAPMTYTRAQVVFVNGKVVQWQIFPAPEY
jgi:hypothetical protein